MSFYDDFENLFLAKSSGISNSTIENVWNIFKECLLELDIDSRDDLGTYSVLFGFSKRRKTLFSITFYFHIVESEFSEEIDENFSFLAECNINDISSIDKIEPSEIEASRILGKIDNNIQKLEGWETYKILRGVSCEISYSQSERFI